MFRWCRDRAIQAFLLNLLLTRGIPTFSAFLLFLGAVYRSLFGRQCNVRFSRGDFNSSEIKGQGEKGSENSRNAVDRLNDTIYFFIKVQ